MGSQIALLRLTTQTLLTRLLMEMDVQARLHFLQMEQLLRPLLDRVDGQQPQLHLYPLREAQQV